MNGKGIKTSLIAAILAVGLAQAGGAFAAERITGTLAVPPGTPGRATTLPVSIYIYDYSTAEEVTRLNEILTTKGREALREELWDLEKGWLRIGDSLGYPIAVARSETTDGKRHIVLLADRPIQFLESWNNSRSLDYPFSFVDVQINQDGTGEGQLIPAAKVRLLSNTIAVESYAFQPARLLGVRVR
ncbi:MAG TPA: hypothetical protein VN493_24260 [Thermoanaerobaculia bacterium]|nr:hypothetical protein [Thermoanaerobaculia bacterium]